MSAKHTAIQGEAKATRDDICDRALKHYVGLSQDGCDCSSTIPYAIEAYRHMEGLNPEGYRAVVEALEKIIDKISYKCKHGFRNGFRSRCPNKDCLLVIAQSALTLARKEA